MRYFSFKPFVTLTPSLIVGSIVLPVFVLPVAGQAPPAPTTNSANVKAPVGPPPAAGAKPEASKPPEKEKDINEFVKEYEKIDGLWTLYRKKKAASDSILMEVTEAQLGKLYLIQCTASTGLSQTPLNAFQGSPLGDIPFRMSMVDDSRIVFIEPNLEARAPKDKAMQRTAERGYPDTILQSFDIKARQKERNSYLIDVTDWFKSDIPDISGRFAPGPGRPSGYAFDRPYAYIDSLKSFPENIVIRSMYKLNRAGNGPGERAYPFAISYNLSALPQTDYVPRFSDIRIGYFLTSYRDISDPSNTDQGVNLIERWNLKKKDPNAPLSDPVKPIKWYMDNGIPVKYREAVKQGLLMYNKAFEEIGIKNAIVVEQMPDNADFDIADVRYNIIRWTNGNPFAIALMRANPLTGELLNAAINMDAVFAAGGASDFDGFVDPSRFFPAKSATTSENDRNGNCDYASAGLADANAGMTMAELMAPEGVPFDKEAYVRQRITQVVSHELGHCLGLRHNFIASKSYTDAQLADPVFVAKNGATSSVMDYIPFNLYALGTKDVPHFSQTVGPYDKWAVAYGYTDFGAKTSEEELPRLRQIASQTNGFGHAFQTDGMADSWDPNIARFDFTSDPLSYVSRRMQVSDNLMRTLDKRAPKSGDSFYEFTRGYARLFNYYVGATVYATRYIGGMNVSSNFKGDPGQKAPLTPVSVTDQKRALNLINQYVFAPTAFNYPKRYFSLLTPNPNNLGGEAGADAHRYPVFDTISGFQAQTLENVFASDAQNRIVNNEFRVINPSETLTLATLYRSVTGNIWSELKTNAEISGLRRSLQREHLDLLIETALGKRTGTPRDGVTLAGDQLRSLRGQIATALPNAKGEYGQPFLRECLNRIDRALGAVTVTN